LVVDDHRRPSAGLATRLASDFAYRGKLVRELNAKVE
jgi:hypothetical protein